MATTVSTAEWKNTARLYALIAPNARSAVLMRRGPTDRVRMISWDLTSDRFTSGQWLKHRVYERRCDLSPDGRYFIYFAADFSRHPGTYTAVSKPPYFTALSLWFKGDAWGGGGLFSRNGQSIYLNHWPGSEGRFHLDEHLTRPSLKVLPLYESSGRGEDDPICYYRMIRDGWSLVNKGSDSKWQGFTSPYHFRKRKPTIYKKTPKAGIGIAQWSLQLSSKYTGETQGRWNVEEAGIVNAGGKTVLDIGRIDWCDLDVNGDILWAWAGKLWRMKYCKDPNTFKLREPILLGDFNDMVFEEMKAPDEAIKW